jgi:hypothetical protein
VTGYVAKSDAEFGKYVSMLIKDGDMRCRMGAAARKSVENRTWAKVFDRLMGFYRSILELPVGQDGSGIGRNPVTGSSGLSSDIGRRAAG